MPVDKVYWSSHLQRIFFIWRWETTIYKNKTLTLKNHGFALTEKKANQKMEAWIISQGETV